MILLAENLRWNVRKMLITQLYTREEIAQAKNKFFIVKNKTKKLDLVTI